MALVTESVDVGTAFKQVMARLRKRARQFLCTVINGGHELYRARTETKLYQQCLLCGYETARLDDRSPRSPVASCQQLAQANVRGAPLTTHQSLRRSPCRPADRSRDVPVVHLTRIGRLPCRSDAGAHQA